MPLIAKTLAKTIAKKERKLTPLEVEVKEVEQFAALYDHVRNLPIPRDVMMHDDTMTKKNSAILDSMSTASAQKDVREWCKVLKYVRRVGEENFLLLDFFSDDNYLDMEKAVTMDAKKEKQMFDAYADRWNSLVVFSFSRPLSVRGGSKGGGVAYNGCDLLRLCVNYSGNMSGFHRMEVVKEKHCALRVKRMFY
tara:strand:+ start:4097 stop:4678 length:582 start_codon:yes stop_codon:yes gene_type:complete